SRGPKNLWAYKNESGIKVREIVVNTDKGGDDLVIVQLTDMHFNYCTENDLLDPVLKSTHDNRTWLADGGSVDNAKRCLAYADRIADQIMITGDTLDYLSEGALDLLKSTVWDTYNNEQDRVMVTLGNHDPVRMMEGKVNENTTFEERMQILQEHWEHNIYYSSKVLGDKVMVIQMDNGSTGFFWDMQVPLLEADLAEARAQGYKVLLFYHIPLSTGNLAYKNVESSCAGDGAASSANFYSEGVNKYSTGASGKIYNLIVNNGDIIAGGFCGHNHTDFYTEISAKTADGAETVIPQYTLIGTPYGNGHALKIIVK
ncbi:MAG: metallophosphoesterase, partial [Clostridia bacterium]|nr:metallophosphoesterase [Clostridia bacterium]